MIRLVRGRFPHSRAIGSIIELDEFIEQMKGWGCRGAYRQDGLGHTSVEGERFAKLTTNKVRV